MPAKEFVSILHQFPTKTLISVISDYGSGRVFPGHLGICRITSSFGEALKSGWLGRGSEKPNVQQASARW